MQLSNVVRINNIIIVTNKKCMYSSINSLPISEYNPKPNNKCKTIFLYRSTNVRVISCFLNWCIKHSSYGWLRKILKKRKDFDYKSFNKKLSNLNNENLISMFKQYLDILEKIFMQNDHMHPQSKIITDRKFKIDTYIDIDNENELQILKHTLNIELPHLNKSDTHHKNILCNFLQSNTKYQELINKIYHEDNILFSKIKKI